VLCPDSGTTSPLVSDSLASVTACAALMPTLYAVQDDAGMRELILAVRADEAGHSHVNHTFSEIGVDDMNPFTTHRSEVAS